MISGAWRRVVEDLFAGYLAGLDCAEGEFGGVGGVAGADVELVEGEADGEVVVEEEGADDVDGQVLDVGVEAAGVFEDGVGAFDLDFFAAGFEGSLALVESFSL